METICTAAVALSDEQMARVAAEGGDWTLGEEYDCAQAAGHPGKHMGFLQSFGLGAETELWARWATPEDVELIEVVPCSSYEDETESVVCWLPQGHEGLHTAGLGHDDWEEGFLDDEEGPAEPEQLALRGP